MTNALISASDSAKEFCRSLLGSRTLLLPLPGIVVSMDQKPLKLISTHGLACCPILPQEMTSVISSMVPGPPGNATYKSASSIIFVFFHAYSRQRSVT